jgi:uncharacterized membrane protein YeaQ/YmgE (transglycosylase-associated protein family)
MARAAGRGLRFFELVGARDGWKNAGMTFLEFVILLVVAGVCGALGQAIVGFKRGGLFVAVALGFIGALIGVWLARSLKLPELFSLKIGSTDFPIIWSIIGSALFVAILSAISRSPRA